MKKDFNNIIRFKGEFPVKIYDNLQRICTKCQQGSITALLTIFLGRLEIKGTVGMLKENQKGNG